MGGDMGKQQWDLEIKVLKPEFKKTYEKMVNFTGNQRNQL